MEKLTAAEWSCSSRACWAQVEDFRCFCCSLSSMVAISREQALRNSLKLSYCSLGFDKEDLGEEDLSVHVTFKQLSLLGFNMNFWDDFRNDSFFSGLNLSYFFSRFRGCLSVEEWLLSRHLPWHPGRVTESCWNILANSKPSLLGEHEEVGALSLDSFETPAAASDVGLSTFFSILLICEVERCNNQ